MDDEQIIEWRFCIECDLKKTICTIFTDSHLPYALTLWESVCHHGPDWLFLALRIGHGQLSDTVPREFRASCIDLASLPDTHPGPPFWYDPFEFCNYTKCLVHEYMWHKADVDEWWFVDADCWFTGDPTQLSSEWSDRSIMLCPHNSSGGILDSAAEISLLFYGVFNGGLLGIRRSPEARQFLDWYTERLKWFCFSEPSMGLYVDQRWLDVANYYIDCDRIRSTGINVGYWNYPQSLSDNKTRLTLLHMSQVREQDDQVRLTAASRMDASTMEQFMAHAAKYFVRIRYWREKTECERRYPFANYRSGVPINRIARRAYYCDSLEGVAPADPFIHDDYNSCNKRLTTDRFIRHLNASAGDFATRLFNVPDTERERVFCYLNRALVKTHGCVRKGLRCILGR